MLNFAKIGGMVAGGVLALAGAASAGTITPDVIFGTGNANGGFTIASSGNLELGLRAKLRYDSTSGCASFGCPQNVFNQSGSTYSFASVDGNPPPDRAMWNFEWGINTDITGDDNNGYVAFLDDYFYELSIDIDPTAGTSFLTYDPLNDPLVNYYTGTNSTPNGGGTLVFSGENQSASNVAQQSVNYGFFPVPGIPLGSGQFTISLAAFDRTGQVASTSIDVIVDAPAIPLPAGLPLLLGAFGGLALFRRKRRT